jgi:hypothetical protein
MDRTFYITAKFLYSATHIQPTINFIAKSERFKAFFATNEKINDHGFTAQLTALTSPITVKIVSC